MLTSGQKAVRELTVTRDEVRAYAETTGDSNPLHFDEAFASRTRFGRLIAQSGFATGLLHALVAMDLPGPGSVFLNQRWSFPTPVYIRDPIRAEATLTAWNERRGIGQMEFVVRNQEGVEVLRGEATVMRVQPQNQTTG